MKVLAKIKQTLYTKAIRYIAHATWVEGRLKESGQTFRILFVENSEVMRYLLPRMYAGEPRILRRRRIWIPSLPKLLSRGALPVDLCIAVLPLAYDPQFRGLCDFRGQEFVRQIVDVPPYWEELKGKLHRTPRGTGRLIRKHGLTYRVSKEPKDLQFFYHRMFVPHTRKQYGNLARIEPFEEMERIFGKGFLLLVEEGGRPIAGSLCMMDQDVLTYRRMGVLDADEAHIQKGGQMAVYYFSLQLAVERRIKKFDLMKSRSFLNDGVYQHKLKWGAVTVPDDEPESWVYFFNRGSPEKAALFFRQNPVVVHTRNGLKVVSGLEDGTELSPEVTSELTERFYAPGLEGLVVLSSRSATPVEVDFQKKGLFP